MYGWWPLQPHLAGGLRLFWVVGGGDAWLEVRQSEREACRMARELKQSANCAPQPPLEEHGSSHFACSLDFPLSQAYPPRYVYYLHCTLTVHSLYPLTLQVSRSGARSTHSSRYLRDSTRPNSVLAVQAVVPAEFVVSLRPITYPFFPLPACSLACPPHLQPPYNAPIRGHRRTRPLVQSLARPGVAATASASSLLPGRT